MFSKPSKTSNELHDDGPFIKQPLEMKLHQRVLISEQEHLKAFPKPVEKPSKMAALLVVISEHSESIWRFNHKMQQIKLNL